jgi:hypothetical protein
MKWPYAIVFFFLYLFPFFFLQEDAYVMVHDTLENELLYIVNILRSGNWFHFSNQVILPNIMEGIPRNAFRSGINYTFGLFFLFPTFWAYVANTLFVHFIGGFGLFLLLKRHFLVEKEQEPFVILMAVAFSWIPYSTIFCGVSVSGQPLLLFAFLNVLRGQQKWYDFLVILSFPFLIAPILVVPFMFVFYIGLYGLFWMRTRRHNPLFLGLLGGLIVTCLLIELPLLSMNVFDQGFVSHRREINRFHLPYLNEEGRNEFSEPIWKKMFKLLIHGKWHSGNFLNLPIWALAIWTYLTLPSARKSLFICIASIFLVSVYCTCSHYLYVITPPLTQFLNLYALDRLYFLQPMLMFILCGISVQHLSKASPSMRKWLAGALWLQFALVVSANLYPKKYVEFRNNLLIMAGMNEKVKEPSFAQFFDTELYGQVKDYIHKEVSSYRIVSLDLPPAAAQYNGFYTLDSYQNNYDIRYKWKFRKVIAKELDKNEILKYYYDNNGSRCYAFSSETMGRLLGAGEGREKEVEKLEWDVSLLKSMNCQYVLSALPIRNASQMGLEFKKLFQGKGSYWEIYLYQIH